MGEKTGSKQHALVEPPLLISSSALYAFFVGPRWAWGTFWGYTIYVSHWQHGPRGEVLAPLASRAGMGRQRQEATDFGERLAALRRQRGLTQVELAARIQATQRSISYYESPGGHAPASVLVKLAQALDVSTDELLGVTRSRKRVLKGESPRDLQLWRRFQLLVQLPDRDQKAVMRMINSLASANGLVNRPGKEGTSAR